MNVAAVRVARSNFMRGLRGYLVAGLLIWVPVGVTVLTFRFLLELMDNVLRLLPASWQPEALFGFYVPGFSVIITVAVLLITGMLVRNLVGSTLVRWWERVLNRVPIVRSVYSGVKGFTETLVSGGGGSFRKVVAVEYPRKEMWSVGFVTASDIPEVSAVAGGTQVCVYVPTTPNPTSGFIVMVS
ncbi:MAG: DUF502 domain-containing protein, partial [Steroidobacteraceae bacterium]